jgi:hypothetical protein
MYDILIKNNNKFYKNTYESIKKIVLVFRAPLFKVLKAMRVIQSALIHTTMRCYIRIFHLIPI